jgi:hypothetical protein
MKIPDPFPSRRLGSAAHLSETEYLLPTPYFQPRRE